MNKWLAFFIHAEAVRTGRTAHFDNAPTYSDEHIEHCARLYMDNPVIREKGVLFFTFLAFPEEVMRAVAGGSAMPLPADAEYYPPLPAQREVRAQLEFEERREELRAEIDELIRAEVGVRAQMRDLERMLAQRRMRVADGFVIEPLHHHTWPKHQQRRDKFMGAAS